MNSYVIVFAALIVAAAAGSVNRNSGWGSPSSPQIDVNLAALIAANGAGQGTVNQQLTEAAIGDALNHASINSVNGVYTGAQQVGGIAQVATGSLTDGVTGTVQTSDVEQDVVASDIVIADINGGVLADLANSAASVVSGEGAMINEANTNNQVNHS